MPTAAACSAAPLPQGPCPVCPHLAERFEPYRQAAYWKRMHELAVARQAQLKAENESLRAQLRRREQQLFGTSSEARPRPGEALARARPRRPRGQQRGSPGHSRRDHSHLPAVEEALALKVLLWSGLRRSEMAGLKWEAVRAFGEEYHFEVVGKRKVRRWFRVPPAVYRDLLAMKTDSPYVFGAYTAQVQHAHAGNPNFRQNVRDDFRPFNLEQWLYDRIKAWAAANGKDPAKVKVHVFRKTTLDHACEGEDMDVTGRVAEDAGVGQRVLETHYSPGHDGRLRRSSTRTFLRVVAGLPAEVARRYGHEAAKPSLEQQVKDAAEAQNWELVRELSARLLKEGRAACG